jgi:hypothetical protein
MYSLAGFNIKEQALRWNIGSLVVEKTNQGGK